MAIPKLEQFSEKAQELVNKMMFEHFSLTWPDIVKQARHRMREDLKAVGGESPEKYHPNLAGLFNFYLNGIRLTAESEILNEFWRMLFSKEYKKMQMKKLEMEIDLSDVQTIPYHRIHDVFMPYGMVICLEKSNTLRIQPWVPDKIGDRYYSRASQAKAIFKVRMLDRWRISLDDTNRALEILKEKNPVRADCLKVDLTKC